MTESTDSPINYNALFAFASGKNLLVDKRSVTWMTTTKDTLLMFNIATSALPKGSRTSHARRLLNLTANHGGDTSIFWAKPEWSGVINEFDTTIYNGLVHNCAQYRALPRWSINNIDSVEYIKETNETFDLVYVDPPFGDEYKTGYSDELFIGTMGMKDLVRYMFDGEGTRLWRNIEHPVMLLKLPSKNYNIDGLKSTLDGMHGVKYAVYAPEDLEKIDNKTHKITLVLVTK